MFISLMLHYVSINKFRMFRFQLSSILGLYCNLDFIVPSYTNFNTHTIGSRCVTVLSLSNCTMDLLKALSGSICILMLRLLLIYKTVQHWLDDKHRMHAIEMNIFWHCKVIKQLNVSVIERENLTSRHHISWCDTKENIFFLYLKIAMINYHIRFTFF